MIGQFTPNLKAGGTIRPYRAVKQDTTTDDQGLECDANEMPIGVTTGQNKAFDNDNHAESGDQILFQTGEILKIEAGASITRGEGIKTDADGKAVSVATTGTTNQNQFGIALWSVSNGEFLRFAVDQDTIRPDPT